MKHKVLGILRLLFTLPLMLVLGATDSGTSGAIMEGSRKRPFRYAGVPTNGVAGTFYGVADPGDLLIDTTNMNTYQNTNTKLSPTWTQLTASSVAYGLVADMAAAGTAASANTVGVSAGAARVDHVHAMGPAILTGLHAAVVANANVVGGIPVVFRVLTAGGATATINVLSTHKIRVTDVRVVNKAIGTTGDTITVKNVTTAITDAISINVADKAISRASTIDYAQWEVAAGTNLAVTETDGGGSDSPACEVIISAMRVA